jgi:phage terminase large subunit-like protein
VTAYARDVVAGRAVVGRLVRLACERHLRDLKEGPARGLRWDAEAALRTLAFFALLRLPADGEMDGKPFKLEAFQAFIVGSVFGWKGADGFRRFRTAYVEQGKGNGKTPLAAGVGVFGLVADREAGAEIYATAVTREQASILFRDAKRIVEASPALRGRLEVGLHNIAFHATDSFFRPLSSEHRGLDGKRPHIALVDEVHEHPTPMVVDKIRAGTKARRQALIFEITNSGYDRTSVCFHHREYSRKVLEGQLEDDSWFAYVCTLDPCAAHAEAGKGQPVDGCPDCDDWRDPAVWEKANPGIDAILPRKYLQEQVREAVGMPSKEGIVKRLNFCLWTENITSWLPAALWSRGAAPVLEEDVRGRPCWGGLDLASKLDLAALVLCFREDLSEPAAPEGEAPAGPKTHAVYRLRPYFWIPADRAAEREHKDRVPYAVWARQGSVFLTPGNVIDFREIVRFIQDELFPKYQIQDIRFDPWNATQAAVELGTFGVTMVEFAQSLRNFNEPAKEFEALLRVGRLLHGDHPVLSWNAGNVAVKADPSGNIRPVKPEDHHDARKVDGVVAAVMALAGAMLAQAADARLEVW